MRPGDESGTRRRAARLAAAAAVALILAAPGAAPAQMTVKLASLAPDGSIWDLATEEMGAEWAQATGGRVQLRIYPGGVAGDEPDVVRKMRIGQLQAASLTVNGLTEIDDAFRIFSVPLFFGSYEELFHVLEALTPELERRLEANGYVLLNWAHAGWVHLFSTRPIRTLDELKGSKLFVAAGDDSTVQWWKQNGYRPVALATTDILTGLQTGMIESLPSPPLAALLLQWYRQAPYMLDLGIAPLVGATVVQTRVWNRISAEDRAALTASAARLGEKLEREVPGQDEEAVAAMAERGLTVVEVAEAAQQQRFRAAAEEFAERVRGDRLPPDILNLALAARAEFRGRAGAGAAGASP